MAHVLAVPAAAANAATRAVHLSHPVDVAIGHQDPQSEAGRDTDPDDQGDDDDAAASSPPSSPSFSSSSPAPSPSLSSPSPSDKLDQEASSLLDARDHDTMDDGLVARVANGPMTRKKMDEEAIAGTVVGVVLGVALLVCCLYPVVVHRIKKKRRAKRLSFDCEGANFRGVRRLSSSDSYNRNSPPRDDVAKDRDRNSHDAYGNPISGPQDQAYGPPTPGYVSGALDQNLTIQPVTSHEADYYSNPFPLCHGDVFAPGTLAPHQVVLKGTSEDYYSPHIPSEAFGMYPETNVPVPKPTRTVSRSTSLKYNVKQLFRPKSTQDFTASTNYSYDQTADVPGLQDATPMQQFFPHRETVESPVEASPEHAEHPFSRGHGSHADVPAESSRRVDRGPSHTSFSGHLFKHNSSQPAPGTVNPMDIMPASTESEMWHRTDYQLYATSHESQSQSPPSQPGPTEHAQLENASAIPSPSPSQSQQIRPPLPAAQPDQTSAPGPNEAPLKKEKSKQTATPSQSDISSQTRLVPVPLPNRPSNSVNQSELSTPAQGTASTTTQSTPSTQADSPSPESLNSSDYCQSASPYALVGVPSPRNGVYCCDEPGCNQVFDQPHKLKHHRRYHSKDHKCPYPTCGKGFGTKTHLQRHINDRHEKKKKFHCSIRGCDYSRAGGKAFPRKDNWKRHMTKIHGMDHRMLPDPVEVDQEMTGV